MSAHALVCGLFFRVLKPDITRAVRYSEDFSAAYKRQEFLQAFCVYYWLAFLGFLLMVAKYISMSRRQRFLRGDPSVSNGGEDGTIDMQGA